MSHHKSDCYIFVAASEWETFLGPKSCSAGFTNYWKYGCYRIGNGGNWADSEEDCQRDGPTVHLAGKRFLCGTF